MATDPYSINRWNLGEKKAQEKRLGKINEQVKDQRACKLGWRGEERK